MSQPPPPPENQPPENTPSENNPSDSTPENDSLPDSEGGIPVDFDPFEEEEAQPRRAASAEFEVAAEIGAIAAMRDAMDPANQSLADALRLSFRVLQLVIVILVALFAVSGAKTVEKGQTGVATRWGQIVEHAGGEALDSGLQLNWPYPAGNFLLFSGENRGVSVKYAFDPLGREEKKSPAIGLRPDWRLIASVDSAKLLSSVMTGDGDLAQVRFSAAYDVEDVGDFVRLVRVPGAGDEPVALGADRLVELMLERAAIHAAAGLDFDTVLAEQGDAFREKLLKIAQQSLDDLQSGVRMNQVTIEKVGAPQQVEKAEAELQRVRNQTDDQIVKARGEAEQTLIGMAGRESGRILDLIEQYEDALALNETQHEEQLLDLINAQLESDVTTGQAATKIATARLYQKQVESVLGNEARRFAGLLPAYRKHPELIVGQYWLAAYKSVLDRSDVEVFWIPPGARQISIATEGLDSVRNIRRELALRRKEQKTIQRVGGLFTSYDRKAKDYTWEREHRLLQRDKEGNLSAN